MKFFSRIKNLWNLSQYAEITHEKDGSAVFTVKGKPKTKMASIIDLSPSPLEEFQVKEEI